MEDAKPANTKRATLIVVGIAAAGLLTFVLVAGIDELTKRNKEVEMSKAVDEANRIDAKATADAAKGLDVPTVEGEVKESDGAGEPAPTTTATSGSGGSGGETGDGGDGEEEKGVKGKLKKGREKVSVLVRNRNFQIAAAVVGIIVLAAIVVGVLYQLQILKFGEDQLIQTPPTSKHDSPGATVDQTQNVYRRNMTVFAGGFGLGLVLTCLFFAIVLSIRGVMLYTAAVGKVSSIFADQDEKKGYLISILKRIAIALTGTVLLMAIPLTLFFAYSSQNPMLWVPMFSFGIGIAFMITSLLLFLGKNGDLIKHFIPEKDNSNYIDRSWPPLSGIVPLSVGLCFLALGIVMPLVFPGLGIPAFQSL